MQDIELNFSKLEKYKEKREHGEQLQIVMGVNQKVQLQRNVICFWQIKEDLEGICTLTFDFKPAERMHNMLFGFSYYQIQRNAEGRAVLVRLP